MQCHNHLCRCSHCTAIIILCSKMAYMKEFKMVEWKGIHNDIFARVRLTRETASKYVNSKYISTLTNNTSNTSWFLWTYRVSYSTIPYHIQTRPKCRNLGKGWGWMYMMHRSSCCSNSRVIAFFNNFCPPPNGWLAGVQEPAWMGGRCQNELYWKLHGIVAPLFFNSPLLSALKWPAREGGGQV